MMNPILLFLALLTSVFLVTPPSVMAADTSENSGHTGYVSTTEKVPLPVLDSLTQTNTLVVQQVIDPVRIRLANQQIVQLAGIDIPDLTPYEAGPIAGDARKFLTETLPHKKVRLYQNKQKDKGRENRFGHLIAHLVTSPGEVWVQGELLGKGLARVRPSEDNTALAEQMMALELQARKQGLGLWAAADYSVLSPETADAAIGNWGIVEGTVQKVATVNNRTYLNFGQNWKDDFTIALEPGIRREMVKGGIDPLSLAHKTIRVRGWLENYNGPYLKLLHPVWLEVLPENGEENAATQKK